MRIHILGICGTFMGGLAVLANQQGYQVSGSDERVYPPMSTMLKEQGIEMSEDYDDLSHLYSAPDCVIIGNSLSRGNPAVEYVLNQGLSYLSGPEWLKEHILKDRWVLAAAGTHGKTTVASLLAWILESAGLNPGFLIGGIPCNFGVSARLGKAPFFVIEADEYDTAFFDKRSKFIHYHPSTLILNNLEFDHADIFSDIAAIKKQFVYLLRTVPSKARIVVNSSDENLNDVLRQGCWSEIEAFGAKTAEWTAQLTAKDGSQFDVYYKKKLLGNILWSQLGEHNVSNALAAIAAARHVNVSFNDVANALKTFKGVKRRLEICGRVNGVTIYDDFAHHPTAIMATLAGLRAKVGNERIIAVLELASNTMKAGKHRHALVHSFEKADELVCLRPNDVSWDIDSLIKAIPVPSHVYNDVDQIIVDLKKKVKKDDHVLIMSNKSFGGLHKKLLMALS